MWVRLPALLFGWHPCHPFPLSNVGMQTKTKTNLNSGAGMPREPSGWKPDPHSSFITNPLSLRKSVSRIKKVSKSARASRLESFLCQLPRSAAMDSLQSMKIEITPRHQRYIDEKVKSGAYGSPDEVVRDGLRLLEAGDERTRRIAWIQSEVEQGFTGPTTRWTAKDTNRVRQLVARRARMVQ